MKASRSFYESDVLCVFVFWQQEKPIETGNVGSVYTIYVVARVDRRFDSSRPSKDFQYVLKQWKLLLNFLKQ